MWAVKRVNRASLRSTPRRCECCNKGDISAALGAVPCRRSSRVERASELRDCRAEAQSRPLSPSWPSNSRSSEAVTCRSLRDFPGDRSSPRRGSRGGSVPQIEVPRYCTIAKAVVFWMVRSRGELHTPYHRWCKRRDEEGLSATRRRKRPRPRNSRPRNRSGGSGSRRSAIRERGVRLRRT